MVTSSASVLHALEALAEAGVSDEFLGKTVRELLRQPLSRARAPEPSLMPESSAPSPPPPEPAGHSRVRQAPAAQPSLTGTAPEIVTFRGADGVRSSVSIPPETWTKVLNRHAGDAAAARAQVRETAAAAPPGANRSQWTSQQLLAPLTPIS